MKSAWLALTLAALMLRAPCRARAQDFHAPERSPLEGGAGAMLEDALPPRLPAIELAATTTAWYGTPLLTRALAVGVGWSALRVSAGMSQTGDPEIGWTALGLGVGVVERGGGIGARAIARRDRTSEFAFNAPTGTAGLDVGAGAWVALGVGVRVWASVPSLGSVGALPPLARPLEIGAQLERAGLTLWLSHSAAPPTVAGASFAAGCSAVRGPAEVWVSARDAPLRGGIGVAVRLPGLAVAGEVESHPWLEPVSRLAITLGRRGP